MKANEFFKKHGLAEVKILLTSPSHGFFFKEDFYKHYGFDIYDDLKRLIDSWALVELCGGLDIAKNLDPTLLTGWVESVNKAIADVESCQ